MRKALTSGGVILALGAVALLSMPTPQAARNKPRTLKLPAVSFQPIESSTHNRQGGTMNSCAADVTLAEGQENRGKLDNAAGSFIAPVNLPHGAEMVRFRIFVNDADADEDLVAHLVRQRLENGLDTTEGYFTIATAKSSDAVTNTIRAFADRTIKVPVVDNNAFMYYVELVDCGIPEPYAVDITYRP